MLRRARFPAYLVLGMAMVFPIVDLLSSLTPMHPSNVMWRFGAMGLGASAVATPLLMLLLILSLALVLGDRPAVMLVAVLASLGVVVLLVGSGSFALDALQMKGKVPDKGQAKFVMASGVALMKLGLEMLAMLAVAVASVRAILSARRESARNTRTPVMPVMGRSPLMPPPAQVERAAQAATTGADRPV